MKGRLLCVTLLAALCCSCSSHRHMGGAEGGHDVLTGGPVTGTTLADLPQPVRDTLRKRVSQAEVADIDRQVRDGKVLYKISFTNPVKYPALTISDDGKIIPAPNNRQGRKGS